MSIILKCVDCITGMKCLADKTLDVAVTSPPYNIGVKYRHYNDRQKRELFLKWCREWTEEVFRILKPNGSFFLNLGACPRDPYLPYELILQLREWWKLQNTFHWIKSITLDNRGVGDAISRGHFKPINSTRFVNDCHEFIFHLTKTGKVPIDRKAVGVPYSDKSNIKRWGHTGGVDSRCRGNVWFIPYKTIQSFSKDRPHPATFPPHLVTMCLKLHGQVNTLHVIDPFVGLGNAAIAAIENGVADFIGFDSDPDYIADALRLVEAVRDIKTRKR